MWHLCMIKQRNVSVWKKESGRTKKTKQIEFFCTQKRCRNLLDCFDKKVVNSCIFNGLLVFKLYTIGYNCNCYKKWKNAQTGSLYMYIMKNIFQQLCFLFCRFLRVFLKVLLTSMEWQQCLRYWNRKAGVKSHWLPQIHCSHPELILIIWAKRKIFYIWSKVCCKLILTKGLEEKGSLSETFWGIDHCTQRQSTEYFELSFEYISNMTHVLLHLFNSGK